MRIPDLRVEWSVFGTEESRHFDLKLSIAGEPFGYVRLSLYAILDPTTPRWTYTHLHRDGMMLTRGYDNTLKYCMDCIREELAEEIALRFADV